MDLAEGSETSAKHNLTPGKHPKEYIQDSEHGEKLKSRTQFIACPLQQWLLQLHILSSFPLLLFTPAFLSSFSAPFLHHSHIFHPYIPT
jgi:hypothetical protein